MNKIMELRNKRNTLWEQTKAFLEEHRGENGLVEASAVEQYDRMAADVQALGTEIQRLEEQAAFEAQLAAPTSRPVTNKPMSGHKAENVAPTATDEYGKAFWDMIRNQGDQFAVRNALSVGEDTEGGYTVPDEFERKLIQALEENNIFRQLATVIRTNSGTRKIPIATDTMEASWIDEGEEIPETNTQFGQTTLSAYKLGTMIKISNELLHDSAFDLASYIAARFGVAMGNAEERAFFTGDGDKKPLGILAETGGAQLGVTAAEEDIVSFDEIFDLYYSLKSPYRRNAQFVCNETLLLQLMKLKDKNDNYIWKPSLDIAKPDTILGRPIRTSSFMPGIAAGERVLLFGDLKNYWVADRQNRTFRRLNELYARTDQVGFMTTQRVDGRLILPESVKVLKMAGTKAVTTGGDTTGGTTGGGTDQNQTPGG
jgi:HK97 family phage major capsid protein